MSSFIVSDTHFGHTNCWAKFKLRDGVTPMRPFSSTEEMDEFMVDQWNKTVNPQDTVYHLGDVVVDKRHLEIVKRLNGKKRLIRGNHDIYKDQLYRDVGFQKIYGVRVFVDKFILSHVPLHPDSITHRFKCNVHGHTHANFVLNMPLGKKPTQYNVDQFRDPRYLPMSVEHTNYRPLSFDEVEERIKKQWKDLNYKPPQGAGWGNGAGPG